MKAVFLATAMTFSELVVATFAAHLRPVAQRARQFLLIYAISLAGTVLVWLATPATLGFLPDFLVTRPSWLDFGLMLFFASAAFFGGVLQLYNLADRGFSLRILIDVDEAGGGPIDAGWVAKNYGAGLGLRWMYRKRLDGLHETGFLVADGAGLVLTPKGRRASRLFVAAKRFLATKPSG